MELMFKSIELTLGLLLLLVLLKKQQQVGIAQFGFKKLIEAKIAKTDGNHMRKVNDDSAGNQTIFYFRQKKEEDDGVIPFYYVFSYSSLLIPLQIFQFIFDRMMPTQSRFARTHAQKTGRTTSSSKFRLVQRVKTLPEESDSKENRNKFFQLDPQSPSIFQSYPLNQIVMGGDRKINELFRMLTNKKRPQKQEQLQIIASDRACVQNIIRNSVCQPILLREKGNVRSSMMIRSSFLKKVKEIKLQKYVCKDEESEQIKCKLQVSAGSVKGKDHNENQDSFAHSEGIYIICDGHGSNGKQISQFVAITSHCLLQQAFIDHKIDANNIKAILKKVQLELENSGLDAAFSGCTFVAVICYQQFIYCVSVGDSKAMLCSGFVSAEISTSHKPGVPTERARIEQAGGVISPIQISKNKFIGPERIWAPGKNSWGPGLALSRAFGDKAARRYGIISTPEIACQQLSFDEQFIVIGSDGLFDFMKNQQISNLIRRLTKQQGARRQDIALRVAEEAVKAAGADSDDTTVLIVFM